MVRVGKWVMEEDEDGVSRWVIKPTGRARVNGRGRGYSAYGSALDAGVGGSSLTAMPALANRVGWWHADDVALSDGASVASWTDSIGGIAMTEATNKPIYKADQINGKGCIRSAGGSIKLKASSFGAVKTAIDSQEYTMMVVGRLQTAAGNGMMVSTFSGTTSHLAFQCDGGTTEGSAGIGQYNNILMPYSTLNTFLTGGLQVTKSSIIGSVHSRLWINGGAAAGYAIAPVTGGNDLTFFNRADGAIGFKGDLFDVVFWNRKLTTVECVQFHKWACDYYAQAYPWAGVNSILVFDGDSIALGIGGGIAHTPPYLAAQSLSRPYGTYHSLGIGSATITQCQTDLTNNLGGLRALMGGKKLILTTGEWFNQLGADPTPYNNSIAYLTAAKALSLPPDVVWWDSTDNTTEIAPQTNRNAYNARWPTYMAGAHPLIDAYAAVSADVQIGPTGAAGTHAANFNGDGLHPSSAGNAFLAADFVTAIQTISGY